MVLSRQGWSIAQPPISVNQRRMGDQTSEAQPALILASASPRRRELLAYLGVQFTVQGNDGEDQPIALPPELEQLLPPLDLPREQHPTLLAWRKAITACAQSDGLILAADTIVVLDGAVLGKPRDEAHAREMLRRLAGREHTVYTGLVALDTRAPQRPLMDLVESQVTMAPLTEAQIAAYVATGEPLDKAGAYGFQGLGGELVSAVRGSSTSVVGLPLPATERLLRAAGHPIPVSADEAFLQWRRTLRKEPPQCTA
jgi:septum formation protein